VGDSTPGLPITLARGARRPILQFAVPHWFGTVRGADAADAADGRESAPCSVGLRAASRVETIRERE